MAAVGVAALLLAAPAGAAEGDVALVAPGADEVSVSGDGSVVAFSTTDALVDEDRNGNQDVYVGIRGDGGSTTFRLISRTPSGQSPDNFSNGPEISADGSTVAFFSLSDALDGRDDNLRRDVFVADVASGAVQRVNVAEDGSPARAPYGLPDAHPSLSADGSLVAFSDTDQLTPDARLTAEGNVYVRDVAAGTTRFVDTGSHPSLSADGKVVAYQLDGQVYAADGDGIELISRTPAGEFGDGASERPDVDADGGVIAFASFATDLLTNEDGAANPGEDVFVFRRDGGFMRLESRDDRSRVAKGQFSDPSLSGDGTTVAFLADSSPNGCTEPGRGTVAVRDIERESTYMAPRALPGELPDAQVGGFVSPSVSADGRAVGYVGDAANLVPGDDNAGSDGFLTELGALEDPTVFTPVREARARESAKELRFDLDVCRRANRREPAELVYSTEDGSASGESDYVPVVDAVVDLSADTGSVGVPVEIADDGEPERCETLYLRVGGNGALRPARALGVIEGDATGGPVYFEREGRIMAVQPCGDPVDVAEGREPAVSPDGERLAFLGPGADGDELVVADAGGRDAKPIATGADDAFGRPAWSPDGKTVAIGAREGGTTVVSLVDAAGEGETVVGSVERAGRTLSFSPDGKLLALDRVDGEGRTVVATLDVAGGELTEVAEGGEPAYGPDGSLAYGRGDILRIRTPGGEERTFTPSRGRGDPPEFGDRRAAWAPDGSAIAFEREAGGNSWIETAPVAGGPTTVLTPAQVSIDHNPAWGGGAVVAPPPALSVSDASVTEGGALGFAVTLSRPAAGDVTVTATTADDTATAGADYTARSATVTVPAGATSAPFDVQTLQDTADEPAETLTVTLSAPGGATIARGGGTGTIVDDDEPPPPPPSASLGSPDPVAEGGVLRFPVQLSAAADHQVTVVVSTRDGSAVAPGDYTARFNAAVTFAPGDTQAYFDVQTKSDLVVEGDETLNAEIDSVTGGVVGHERTRMGTITDVPPSRAELDTPAPVAEGGVLRFPVTLDRPASHDVTVVLRTRDGTAVAPGDYTARTNAQVTIPAGDVEGTFEVQTNRDVDVESSETVNAEIDSVTGGLVGYERTKTGTITDVPPPTATLRTADQVAEGGVLRFPVRLSAATYRDVILTLATRDGSATAPGDYTARFNAQVTIPAGQTEAFFDVQTIDDAAPEVDEIVNAELEGAVGARVGSPHTATGRIGSDDPAVATIGRPEEVDEGELLRFPVVLSDPLGVPATVRVRTTADGTAQAPGDFTARALSDVTIPAGQTEAFFDVQTIDDAVVEADETVTVEIRNGTNITVGSPSSGSGIIHSDDLPSASVATPAAVDQGATLRFPVRLSTAAPGPVTVVLSTRDGTATAPSDYAARTSQPVTVAAGQTEAFFDVQTTPGGLDPDETVHADIVSASGATVGNPSTATGTIRGVPAASVGTPATVDEGAPLRFPVTISRAYNVEVRVRLSTVAVTATPGIDYTERLLQEVTIPAGQTQVFFDVQTVDDILQEPDETVGVEIRGGTNIRLGSPVSATGTIHSTDLPLPAASIGAPATVDEGAVLRFPVTISRSLNVESRVRLSTVAGTATAGADYTERLFQDVTIPPGQTQAYFDVQTIDDPLVEADETVKAEIRGGTNISLGSPSSATGTIHSTDIPPPAASVGTPAAVEEGTALKFPVTISRAINVESRVRLSTVDGTAKAGDDYTARSLQEVTIPAGQTSATFTVDTLKDQLAESDETVKVEIRGGTNISLGSPASATGTITDPAPMRIVRGDTVGGQVLAGTVTIKLPQTKVPLDLGGGAVLPVGTIVDATAGTIEIVSATATSKATLSAAKTQRARFSGGIFTIRQKKGAALVTLQLSGPELRRCPKAAGVRRLEGDGRGAFAIQGRFASAAVRSGRWSVEDRCAATTVKVRRGRATVRDLVRKRSRALRAGRSLTVRKR